MAPANKRITAAALDVLPSLAVAVSRDRAVARLSTGRRS